MAILVVTTGSSYVWDRTWQLLDKCNSVGIIKSTKVHFLFLKLIKAEAVLRMFLAGLMLLCRGVLLGRFAVPVPILSLFTKSCCVCIEGALC